MIYMLHTCGILTVFISVTLSLILPCVTVLLVLFWIVVNGDIIYWQYFCNYSDSNYPCYKKCPIHDPMLANYLVFRKGYIPTLLVILLAVPYDSFLLLGKCPLFCLFLHFLWEYTRAYHWKFSLIGLYCNSAMAVLISSS